MDQKDNSGALFPVENPSSEKAPTLTGKCTINGSALRIAAWTNTSKAGKKYISLKFSPDEPWNPDAKKSEPKGNVLVDDDLPF
tara:strand:+ start:4417 stop:4665 length:249 start_codon:yes stop_codon:yes gene_type:complete